MQISIILPSRGLIFAEVEEGIEDMRSQHSIKVYRCHDKPIPEAQNYLVDKALLAVPSPDFLMFVEEDTVPPQNALEKLLAPMRDKDVGITCIDYAMHNNFSTITKKTDTGEILFCGLGMTLVKTEVFHKIQWPYFRADKAYSINQERWIEGQDPHKVYGMHDIYFGSQIRKAGYKIIQVEGECRHLKVDVLGAKEINSGVHTISEKGHVVEHYTLQGNNI